MEVEDTLKSLADRGLVDPVGTNAAGETIYRTTKAGRRAWWRAIRRKAIAELRETFWNPPAMRYVTVVAAFLVVECIGIAVVSVWMAR